MRHTPSSRLFRPFPCAMPLKAALIAALWLGAPWAPALGAESGLRVGVQGTLGRLDIDIDAPVLGATGGMDGAAPSVGVLAQYVFDVDEQAETGLFFGVEAGFATERFSETYAFHVNDAPASATSEAAWSADLLWLVGYDFGKLSAFASTGITFAGNEMDIVALGPLGQRSQRGSDQNKHVGWKLGPGLAVDLGRSSVVARVNYALFKPRNYTVQRLTLEAHPTRLDINVAWVRKVDDLRFWRR